MNHRFGYKWDPIRNRDHYRQGYGLKRFRSEHFPESDDDDRFQVPDDEGNFVNTSKMKSICDSDNEEDHEMVAKKKAGSETEDEKADDKQTDGGIQAMMDRLKEEKEKMSLDAFHEQLRRKFPNHYNKQEKRAVKEEDSLDDYDFNDSFQDLSDDSE